MKNLTLDWWVEWSATVVLIIGVWLTAYNIYPANVYFCLLGNLGWFFVAILWRKWSLGVVQVIVTAIYVAGLMNYWGWA